MPGSNFIVLMNSYGINSKMIKCDFYLFVINKNFDVVYIYIL